MLLYAYAAALLRQLVPVMRRNGLEEAVGNEAIDGTTVVCGNA